MALEHLEGTSYGPVSVEISAAKVGEYVAATRNDEPERWTTAAPPAYAGALLFAVAPVFLASDEVAGHTAVLIHADQAFTWEAPMAIGTALEITGRVERVRGRGGIDFVSFGATAVDRDGAVLLESSSTFLLGAEAAGDPPEPRSERPVAEDAGWTPGPIVDGDVGEPGTRSASRLDLVRYAAASGDFNPIHFDHDAAVGAGLPGVVVHGLLMGAWMLDAASHLADGDRPLAAAKLRFRDPLLPAEPATLEAGRADGSATVELALTGGDGRSLVTARVDLAEGVTQ